MTRWLTLAVLVLTLMTAAPASAGLDDPLLPPPDGYTYLRIAERYWRITPSCGRVFFYNTWALESKTVAMADSDGCWINWDQHNRWQPTAYGWCLTVVHEYGHLIGREHTFNSKRYIMYGAGPWDANVPGCNYLRDPGPWTNEVLLHGKVWTRTPNPKVVK